MTPAHRAWRGAAGLRGGFARHLSPPRLGRKRGARRRADPCRLRFQVLSWLFKEFPDPDPSASPHSLGEKREPPSPLSQLGDADPASRPHLSPAAGVGGEGLPRGAGALAVASSPRGSHPSPGRPQWRWGDLARVFLRVTRSRSAALRVPPGKAAADTSR